MTITPHHARRHEVGNATLFVTGTSVSRPVRLADLVVIYGPFVLSCANLNAGASAFATQQSALTQVCQQVISRL